MGLREAVELVERVGAGLDLIDRVASSAAQKLGILQATAIGNGPGGVLPVRPRTPGIQGTAPTGMWAVLGPSGAPLARGGSLFRGGSPVGMGGGSDAAGNLLASGLLGDNGGYSNFRGALEPVGMSSSGGNYYQGIQSANYNWWANPNGHGLGEGPPDHYGFGKVAGSGPAAVQDVNSGRQTAIGVATLQEIRGLRGDLRNGTSIPVQRRAAR